MPDKEDDFNFAERFIALKAEGEEQLIEETRLNKIIAENLSNIDYGDARQNCSAALQFCK